MRTFYVTRGMIVDEIHVIFSFKQSMGLEEDENFSTQKRNKAENGIDKYFYKLLIHDFYGKTMENVRNRTRLELFKKDDIENIIKQQSKLTFKGIHNLYENCNSYTFKQNDVLMDKAIFLIIAVLELSKLHMYKT